MARKINVVSIFDDEKIPKCQKPIPDRQTDGLTPKFHEEINCKPPLWPYIIKTNLTKKNFLPTGSHFHEDQTINVAFTVLTSQPKPSFLLIQDIKYSDKFHEDWTINVTFGPYMYYEKCPNPGGHVFQPTRTIFELVQDIIGTILLTKVHKDRTINVASRPNGCHVFQPTRHIIEFAQVIIRTNLLTKFHGDRTINVTSRGVGVGVSIVVCQFTGLNTKARPNDIHCLYLSPG
ncbi:hypothetical protein DPMN_006141 [Dreissena polymorpha]|uniref:Uncharacterized protein n=1 Tax=Dreissena polymorpha TaxID=45954 RepID=A0A9D4RX78_DREPO|nr:hypothetical protein DPMN_006141 [Dreissena polymorpha]